jgi:hypothetical protein
LSKGERFNSTQGAMLTELADDDLDPLKFFDFDVAGGCH